jgi:hypothetical protein
MATYYLNADTGNDTTGSGTSGSPWKTISKAHTSATSGDTIICQSSTAAYTWSSQTFTKNLTIQGVNSDATGVVFDALGAAFNWYIQSILTFYYITFKNATGLYDPFYINTASKSATFYNCKFQDLATTNNGGFFSIFLIDSVNSCSYNFYNCTFINMESTVASPTVNSIFGYYNTSGSSLVLRNCVFHWESGVYAPGVFFDGSATITAKNSVYYNVSGNTARMTGIGSSSSSYNDYYTMTSAPSGTGDITSDPLFVDAANYNYNLRPTSPCINAGTLV